MALRLTVAKTPKPLWIQVCSVIGGGKCWLMKKLTRENQKSHELWITHLNMWHRWRFCRAWYTPRGSLSPTHVELPSEWSTARSTVHMETHWIDWGMDKLRTFSAGSSSGILSWICIGLMAWDSYFDLLMEKNQLKTKLPYLFVA